MTATEPVAHLLGGSPVGLVCGSGVDSERQRWARVPEAGLRCLYVDAGRHHRRRVSPAEVVESQAFVLPSFAAVRARPGETRNGGLDPRAETSGNTRRVPHPLPPIRVTQRRAETG